MSVPWFKNLKTLNALTSPDPIGWLPSETGREALANYVPKAMSEVGKRHGQVSCLTPLLPSHVWIDTSNLALISVSQFYSHTGHCVSLFSWAWGMGHLPTMENSQYICSLPGPGC